MSKIVALTGAGISAESGLRTFRTQDAKGNSAQGSFWEEQRIEDVCTPEALERNPTLVFDFYNQLRRQLPNAQPNPGHLALAELAENSELFLVTQNIDDLHERAGSPKVWHMHGELLAARCNSCRAVSAWQSDFNQDTECPVCQHKNLRPHIVFFGEIPFFMEEIYSAVTTCDIFLSIGTSSVVYPAAGLVDLAQKAGAECLEFNLAASGGDFSQVILGKAGLTLPRWLAEFCSKRKL